MTPPDRDSIAQDESVSGGHHPACTYPNECDCKGAFVGATEVRGYFAPCVTRGHVDCEIYLTMQPVVSANHIRVRSSGAADAEIAVGGWEFHVPGSPFHYLGPSQSCACEATHLLMKGLNTNGRGPEEHDDQTH